MAFLDPYDLETMGNILNWHLLYNSNLERLLDAIGAPCFQATAGENLSEGQVVCIDASSGQVYKADADNPDRRPAVGVVYQGASAGGTVWVQFAGKCSKFSGLSAGALYYLSTSAGEITTTPPASYRQVIGRAINSSTIVLNLTAEFNVAAIDHGTLTGLSDDDHTQYVHTSTARTISAQHTFNPPSTGAPFVLGANAQGQLVTGLNADQLDGQHASHFLAVDGSNSPTADMDWGGHRITNLADPTGAQDAATKAYADTKADTDLSNVDDTTVLNKVKNVDGTGSGLDADLLDGHDSSDQPVAGQIPVLDSNGHLRLPERLIVGSTTADPHSVLQSQGSLAVAVTAITMSTTLGATHCVVAVDASGGTVTVTLPGASNCEGRLYVIKKTDSSSYGVTIDAGSSTIDGNSSVSLSSQWNSVTIVSDGTNWLKIAET